MGAPWINQSLIFQRKQKEVIKGYPMSAESLEQCVEDDLLQRHRLPSGGPPPSSNSNHLPNVPLPNSMTLWGRDPDIETIAGSVCWRRSLSKRIKKTRGAREDRSLGIEKLLWKSLISDLPFFLSVICPWDPVSMSPVLLVVVLFSFWWKSK